MYVLTFDVALMRFQETVKVDLCVQQVIFPKQPICLQWIIFLPLSLLYLSGEILSILRPLPAFSICVFPQWKSLQLLSLLCPYHAYPGL